MDQEQEVGVIFPLAGIDSTCEFSRQPPDTTPSGVNVRTYETITRRARGGSRQGQTEYVASQVNGVAAQVQHLNVLVDPQDPALDEPVDQTQPFPTVLDPSSSNNGPGSGGPRNFGRYVRVGGGGNVPNRNNPHRSGVIQFVANTSTFVFGQQNVFGGQSKSTFNLNLQPAAGNKIILSLVTAAGNVVNGPNPANPSGPCRPASVTTGSNFSYTQVGGGSFFAEYSLPQFGPGSLLSYFSVSQWHYQSTGAYTDQSVIVTSSVLPDPSTPYNVYLVASEYRNVAAGGPFTYAKAASSALVASWSPGLLSLAGSAGEMALWYAFGGTTTTNVGDTYPPANVRALASPGFKERGGFDTASLGGQYDQIGLTAGTLTPVGSPVVLEQGPTLAAGPNVNVSAAFAAIGSIWRQK